MRREETPEARAARARSGSRRRRDVAALAAQEAAARESAERIVLADPELDPAIGLDDLRQAALELIQARPAPPADSEVLGVARRRSEGRTDRLRARGAGGEALVDRVIERNRAERDRLVGATRSVA